MTCIDTHKPCLPHLPRLPLWALATVLACSADEVPATTDESSTTDIEGDGDGDGPDEPEPPPGCGDGVVDEFEDCDDGNQDNDDGCLSWCVAASCGDGYVWKGMEDCDDNNFVPDDGCTNMCTLPACGDLVLQPGEECDDGDDDDFDSCLTNCTLATCGDGYPQNDVEACDDGNDDNNDLCTNDCQEASCGDGMIQGNEACDDSNTSYTDACLPGCISADCGDGWVHAGVEECDDGNATNTDACTNDCNAAVCGDGIVRAGVEACDDGNANNADACTNNCSIQTCGDGIPGNGEACDDGNDNNNDYCLNTCILASCGDGFKGPGEACDDGNTNNRDGCLTTCALARSCKHIRQEVPSSTTGVYRIDPDGNGGNSPRDVLCDMSTDGGGWTMVASSRTWPPADQAGDYHTDLTTIHPIDTHAGVWTGMRPLTAGDSDIRFTCMTNPNANAYTVDLSFYDILWYGEITTGSDAQSCFSENNGYGDDQPEPARRNNLNGSFRPVNDAWNQGYLEGEDYCGDVNDFMVDFDDRGMDSPSDGTDWGLDDGVRRCRYYNIGMGAWHIWVREL